MLIHKRDFPLTFLLAFSIILLAFRTYITQSDFYWFLFWNLLLAILPLVFVKLAYKQKTPVKLFFLFLWLMFYPNTLYIFSDYIHLKNSLFSISIFILDFFLIGGFSLTGIIFGFRSLRILHKIWIGYFGNYFSWFLIFLLSYVTSFALYLGRTLRFNSWDVLFNVKSIFVWLKLTFSNTGLALNALIITFVFGSMHLCLYIIYTFFVLQPKKPKERLKNGRSL